MTYRDWMTTAITAPTQPFQEALDRVASLWEPDWEEFAYWCFCQQRRRTWERAIGTRRTP